MMTSKERMLTALNRRVPDRLPASVHQWMDYHRKHYLGGIGELEAFRKFGLDASVGWWPGDAPETPDWKVERKESKTPDGKLLTRTTFTTPEGALSESWVSDEHTGWIVELRVKHYDDIHLIRKYMPVPKVNRDEVVRAHDELGDDGILRGGVIGHQAGPWQDACCLFGAEAMILETFDNPSWVRDFLDVLLEKRLEFIDREMRGLPLDLVETGGGAASSTVISPDLFRTFVLPVDRMMHDALHAAGQKIVYHTCGGMMDILELIVDNGCDASETLSPAEVGGDARPVELKARIGRKVALIGGMNQFQVLTQGTPEAVRNAVRDCFQTYGVNGGYIMSTCDHFFDAPVENIQAYADAAKECVYG
jgi:uroporphyrinogen-III decarboxylase